jgi:hypothetical protein
VGGILPEFAFGLTVARGPISRPSGSLENQGVAGTAAFELAAHSSIRQVMSRILKNIFSRLW